MLTQRGVSTARAACDIVQTKISAIVSCLNLNNVIKIIRQDLNLRPTDP